MLLKRGVLFLITQDVIGGQDVTSFSETWAHNLIEEIDRDEES